MLLEYGVLLFQIQVRFCDQMPREILLKKHVNINLLKWRWGTLDDFFQADLYGYVHAQFLEKSVLKLIETKNHLKYINQLPHLRLYDHGKPLVLSVKPLSQINMPH